MNRAEPGSNHCRAHGGRNLAEIENRNGYLLAKAEEKGRLASLSDEMEPVKELRDNIALLHMMIERRWNLIKSDADYLAACGPLNQMFQNMDRLVNSCHKIEQNLGALLAKNAILSLAKQMVEVIIEELEGIDNYEEIVDRITDRLINLIRGTNNSEPSTMPPLLALPSPEETGG
jgi:hypothetical protein